MEMGTFHNTFSTIAVVCRFKYLYVTQHRPRVCFLNDCVCLYDNDGDIDDGVNRKRIYVSGVAEVCGTFSMQRGKDTFKRVRIYNMLGIKQYYYERENTIVYTTLNRFVCSLY